MDGCFFILPPLPHTPTPRGGVRVSMKSPAGGGEFGSRAVYPLLLIAVQPKETKRSLQV